MVDGIGPARRAARRPAVWAVAWALRPARGGLRGPSLRGGGPARARGTTPAPGAPAGTAPGPARGTGPPQARVRHGRDRPGARRPYRTLRREVVPDIPPN